MWAAFQAMLLTPAHWRERASHARTQATFIMDPEGRRLLLEVAKLYDRLEERAKLVGTELPYKRRSSREEV